MINFLIIRFPKNLTVKTCHPICTKTIYTENEWDEVRKTRSQYKWKSYRKTLQVGRKKTLKERAFSYLSGSWNIILPEHFALKYKTGSREIVQGLDTCLASIHQPWFSSQKCIRSPKYFHESFLGIKKYSLPLSKEMKSNKKNSIQSKRKRKKKNSIILQQQECHILKKTE